MPSGVLRNAQYCVTEVAITFPNGSTQLHCHTGVPVESNFWDSGRDAQSESAGASATDRGRTRTESTVVESTLAVPWMTVIGVVDSIPLGPDGQHTEIIVVDPTFNALAFAGG